MERIDRPFKMDKRMCRAYLGQKAWDSILDILSFYAIKQSSGTSLKITAGVQINVEVRDSSREC